MNGNTQRSTTPYIHAKCQAVPILRKKPIPHGATLEFRSKVDEWHGSSTTIEQHTHGCCWGRNTKVSSELDSKQVDAAVFNDRLSVPHCTVITWQLTRWPIRRPPSSEERFHLQNTARDCRKGRTVEKVQTLTWRRVGWYMTSRCAVKLFYDTDVVLACRIPNNNDNNPESGNISYIHLLDFDLKTKNGNVLNKHLSGNPREAECFLFRKFCADLLLHDAFVSVF